MAHSSRDLDRVFQELKSKNDDVRFRAAGVLRQTVDTAHRELPPGQFSGYYASVISRISTLVVQSLDTYDRIGGILALDALIDFKGDDAGVKTSRFSGYLQSVLRGNDTTAMVFAARALGRLAIPGGTLTAELVEAEVKGALESLQSERKEQELRRYSAVLVLKELARNSPTLIYSWIPQIFEVIWSALRDQKLFIREKAAEMVRQCITIMSTRDAKTRDQWLNRVYEEALHGFGIATNEAVHGSLLTVRELFDKGAMFMEGNRYREACEIVLKYKDHKELAIRKEVVQTIPVLANYTPNDFATSYLHPCMVHLQGLMRRDKEKGISFLAVGQIAGAVGSNIAPYLDSIIGFVREGLLPRNRTKVPCEAQIFECLSMISIAVGQAMSKHVPTLLDPMFACGLSEALTQALVDMAHYIPPAKATIQQRLLNLLSQILCGRQFVPLGAPHHTHGPIQIWTRDHKDPQTIEQRESEIALSLQTLGSFDFSGHVLNEFVRDVAIQYVNADNPDIRKAASLTACQLFLRDPIVHQTSRHAIRVVGDVIQKLLTVGVADPDPEIRRVVLKSLDTRFDNHLGKADNVRSLFLALNDEFFANREAAMEIIGRISDINPAYIFPSLRKAMIQQLTQIQYSSSARSKEESARLLSHLVTAGPKLMKAFADPMVTIMLPKARDANPELASTTLEALGNCAAVGGRNVQKFIPQLMGAIIENLQDLSSETKRIAALHALGQIATSCGYVIDPYKHHPELTEILHNIVKHEGPTALRGEAVKVMGILGAVDPDVEAKLAEKLPEQHLISDTQPVTDVTLVMNGTTPSNEEYYPTVVIHTLMGLLKDNSLAQYHSAVIDAVMNIYATMGLKCVPFLGLVIPGFVTVIQSAPPGRVEGYFNQLSQLVRIVKQHIRQFLPTIIQLIDEYWNGQPLLQATILSLIESISRSLEGEFKRYLAPLLPKMLSVLDTDASPSRLPSERVLHAFLIFGNGAEDYLHLIIPVIVRMFEKTGQPQSIRKQAIETLGRLSRKVNLADYAPQMILPLGRILSTADTLIRQTVMDTLCALVYQIGQDYIPFISTMNKILQNSKITHANYAQLVNKLARGESLPQDLSPDHRYGDDDDDHIIAEAALKELQVNQQHLKSAWEASQKSTKEDWIEWMRRLSVELLRESPQQALRACTPLASIYNPIARQLFNSAFVSCWTKLYDQYQEDLVHSIETALTSTEIPPDILQMLLNLAEFMEHDDKALPIDVRLLGAYAMKCHAYAKALHYKELEFNAEQNPNAVEALIGINNHLQQYDAAFGILRKAQNYHDVDLREFWYEKLSRWDEALIAYQRKEDAEGEKPETTMGKMRCLHALGEWDVLSALAEEKWVGATSDWRRHMAPLAAAAAWGLGKWDLMDQYLKTMKNTSPDRSFFGAILCIHRNQFDDALTLIERARGLIETELTALLSESYDRAYLQVLRVQMLSELEEVMAYKKFQAEDDDDKMQMMRLTWAKRLKGCQPNPEVWQRMMKVRSLVIGPSENIAIWIKYTNLCRKNNRLGLAEKSLHSMLNTSQPIAHYIQANMHNTEVVSYKVAYTAFKYMWGKGQQGYALDLLKGFSTKVSEDISHRARHIARTIEDAKKREEGHRTFPQHQGNPQVNPHLLTGQSSRDHDTKPTHVIIDEALKEDRTLLAKCYLRLGEWQEQLLESKWEGERVHHILAAYKAATEHNKSWYKAWHAWALANFEVINSYNSSSDRETTDFPSSAIKDHVVPAIEGFFQSISLSLSSSLQDTLRLLTMWFAHGGHPDVRKAVREGIELVSVDTWLEVIPQLLARINQPNRIVRESIHNLLIMLGRAHPQALVFPFTVSVKSDAHQPKSHAKELMEVMRQHSPKLVEQAELVSTELIRIAVLWHEQWHEGLEEASRLYFGDRNIPGMFSVLKPLHDMVDDGPQTLREISFIQSFGRELGEARDWCNTFKQTREEGDINQAWDLYYQVFRKIARQLPTLLTLEMQYVSPKLRDAKDLDVAIPGTYYPRKPVVRIASFDSISHVIQSKQRPRRLILRGSDGNNYQYILKGHEDIRQDERVMQLFGLCNTLLANDAECRKRHLDVQRYSAIPLSTQSGLLSFVPNSDTLHVLIREYRESRKILLNIEHRIMLQMAPDYDSLTLMQKVEVFGYALDNTTGQDLYRVLWLKSKSSEQWLARRTNYTRSLAVMSMVGYILGLGDRHPSNLMLDRITGKIVHIDFGDCFEVAMHREKYPERVPFRLTRMLTYAMEVSNIEGSYRTTCEHVMRVLRDNKESVMAVLEAFIHDPLLTWRLNNRESPGETSFTSERRASIIGVEPAATGAASSIPDHPLPSHTRRDSSYRPRARSSTYAQQNAVNDTEAKEVQNARALQVLGRVREKVTGRDFKPTPELGVDMQVDRLIREATNLENLCQHYIGWCSFW
ncbi:TOR1 phosphatidylinositol 3-kinase [Eremomyces bilateralis CBS 781.70]|uniref:Serine/threonine-protein kinase TOR n=1 Tax=Eremomyces bilateralis CBS 781.70 TaxID=1392243 RepID=A0A6G1GA68_9PEZI|nr:TOR1 phosphatidylinositol 3-kinase [Eremomyces bilateralis CBS 781.70]KAF1814810.1 TOR1 phosphatidylinositol 3-kinase [Eremomyces bilateralis CBS 781.70]